MPWQNKNITVAMTKPKYHDINNNNKNDHNASKKASQGGNSAKASTTTMPWQKNKQQ